MILFFGDTHGDLSHVLPIVQKENPVAIILLGDVQSKQPLDKDLAPVMELTDIWWIPGNHDTDSVTYHDNLFNSKLAHHNLHGRIVEIDGLKVAGLGGIFREKIWWPFPLGNPPKFNNYEKFQTHLQTEVAYHKVQQGTANAYLRTHKSTIFPDEWYHLYAKDADILVTHEAPSCHRHGFDAIDQLAKSMKVKKTFHGHHHDRQDYSSHNASLGFQAYGVGLRGVSDFNGSVIRQGELDVQRMRSQF
jgi:predicted phosphodiesterase